MRRLFIALFLLAACSSEQPSATESAAAPANEQKPGTAAPPSAQKAREMIAASSEFGQHEFTNAAVSMPISGAVMNEPTRQSAKQLAAGGWLEIDGAGDVMFTPRSRQDKRFVLRENGLLDVVPLAKKEMGDVTAVRQNPDGTVSVDFTWRWVANEVGKSLTSGPIHDRFDVPQNAAASLMWNGSDWTMISVESR